MRRSLIWISLMAIASVAQIGSWPSVLVVPEPSAPHDSSAVHIVAQQRMYDKSFRGKSQLAWQRNDSIRYWMQSASYDLTYDHGAFGDVVNQYLDMTGCIARKEYPLRQFLAGLEWKPVLMLNTKERSALDGGVFQGDLYLGPFISLPVFWGIPVKLGVGGAARAWNTAVADQLYMTKGNDFRSAGGFYGSGEIGEWAAPVRGLPLHFAARGEARALGEAERLIGGLGSLLYAHGLPTADSIFFFVADSVINGKKTSLSESAEGKNSFVNTPSRIENSLRLAAGLRLRPRFRFAPGIEYVYLDHSRQYPWNPKILSDVRRTQEHSFSLMLASEDFLVDYRGGMRFAWRNEDWIFDRRVEALNEKLVNINDQTTFQAEMVHEAGRDIIPGLGLTYRYSISRELRTYETKETLGLDTLRNNGDHDEVQQQHEAETHFISSELCSVSVFGAYGLRLSRYLKKERSADNITDQRYKIGVAAAWNRWKQFVTLSEIAGIAAEISEYQYPAFHVYPDFDPAPYKRRFFSKFATHWRISRLLDVRAGFDWRYDDNGYWNGRELYDSVYLDTVGTNFREYYAPQFKLWETALELTPVMHVFDAFDIEAGGMLKYIRLEGFFRNAYEVLPEGGGYWLIPCLRVTDAGESAPWNFAGAIKAYIDMKKERPRIDAWEVTVLLNAGF